MEQNSSGFFIRLRDQRTLFVLLLLFFGGTVLASRLHRDLDETVSPPEYQYQIDLNRAEIRELEILPGIGEKLAGEIILHRQTRGPFEDPKDLMKTKGVGPKRFETIRSNLAEIPSSDNP